VGRRRGGAPRCGRRGAPKRHSRAPGKVRTSHFGLGPATASEVLAAGRAHARIAVSTRHGRAEAGPRPLNAVPFPRYRVWRDHVSTLPPLTLFGLKTWLLSFAEFVRSVFF